MLKFSKKQNILLIMFIFIFISGFFIIQKPYIIADLFLFEAKATQQSVALSITITGSEEENILIPSSGEIKPTDTMIQEVIPKISGLTNHENDEIKVRVYTADETPQGFIAPSSIIVETVYNYINITLNTTLTQTATIFFNITKSDLGTTDPDDIRLYYYTTSWTELPTIVLDSTQDPVPFQATTTSFSHFLIGKKAAGLPSVTTPLGASPSHGGLKLGKEQPVPRPKPVKLIIPTAKKIIEKIIKLPAHLIRYKISYNIIYITTISLILLIISLEIIYHFLSKKK